MSKSVPRDEKSRSQVKREFRELKELGVRLARLAPGQLRRVPLSDRTREAVLAARELTRSAMQRQFRYLSSLLAEEDVAAIRAALADELRPHAEEVAALHEAEGWRDRLLAADGDQAAFVERFPHCDRTRLGQLVRNARKERSLEKPPRSARLLLRYIRELSATEGTSG